MEFMNWNNCIVKLALDILYPIYESMGLNLSESQKFQKILQFHINDNLEEKGNYPWLKEQIFPGLLIDLQENLMEDDYRYFIYFATTVFSSDNEAHKKWENWKDAFRDVRNAKKFIKVGYEYLAQNELFEELINKYDSLKSLHTKLNKLYDEFNYEKLSDWDKRIFDI